MSYIIRPVIVIVKYRVEDLLQSLDNIGGILGGALVISLLWTETYPVK